MTYMFATMVQREQVGNDFALCPDNGPPRLIRYDLPWSDFGLICALDFETNLLRVCREYYDVLTDNQRHQVLLTRREFLYVRDLAR